MENASVLDRLADIESEFQEPLRAVVAGFIPLGMTRVEVAETLEVSPGSMRRYCEQTGIHFPRNQPGRADRCRAATRKSRCATLLEHNGRTQCLTAWAEEYGIRRVTLSQRIRRGRTLRQALAM